MVALTVMVTLGLVFPALAFALFLKNDERTAVTQCFRPKTVRPCEQWQGGHEYCTWFFETYRVDEARGCYGQRWAFPKGYFSRKYISYHPITETIVILVDFPSLAPGGFIPRKQRIPLYNEVNIWALWSGKFEEHVQHIKRVNQSTGWVRTGQVLYDMEVFDLRVERRRNYGSRYIFLFPSDNAQLFLKCLTPPADSIDRIAEAALPGGCQVVSNVDDRVRIEYYAQYSQLPEINKLNLRLVSLVRRFMVTN